MEPAKPIVAEKPKRQFHAGYLLGGIVLGGVSAAALHVDIGNNWAFGSKINHEAATIGIVSAVGVAFLPAVTPIVKRIGHDVGWAVAIMRIATLLCVATTITFGYLGYRDRQAEELASRSGRQDVYAAARDAEKAARDEARQAREAASKIDEAGSVGDLEDLVSQKQAALSSATETLGKQKLACSQSRNCRRLEGELTSVRDRLGKARTKREELARAVDADKRAEVEQKKAHGGPVQAGAMANENAMQGIAILTILVTVFLGLLGEPAVACLSRAFSVQEQLKPKPVRTAVKKAVSVVEMGQKEKLDACLDTCTAEAPDGPLVGSDKFRVMVADYWRAHHNGEPVPSQKAIGQAMAARYKRGKDPKSGKIGYYARIDYKLSLVGKAA